MIIEPINIIAPLREDLKKAVPDKFYTSTEYKRWTITSGLSEIWSQALQKTKQASSYYVIYGDSDVEYAGGALTLLLNHFYSRNRDALISLVVGIIQTYNETNQITVDIKNIKLDLQAAGFDEAQISQLDNLQDDTTSPQANEFMTEEQRVRFLENDYKNKSEKEANSRAAIDAYIEWHSAALLYLSEHYTLANSDFKQFKELDNSHNGYGLHTNFKSIYSIYNLLMMNAEKQTQQTLSSGKTPMVFISHSSKDKPFVEALVTLLEDLGMTSDNLFCSSVPGYGIGLSKNIFDTLRDLFLEHELFVIFVHSPRYYESSVSLNEMGAAWVLRTNFCSFLTVDMDFAKMNGVINGDAISIKVDSEDAPSRLNELKDLLATTFSLSAIDENKWERKRNNFLKLVTTIAQPEVPTQQASASTVDEEFKRLQIERMKTENEDRMKACIRSNVIRERAPGRRTLKIFNAGKAEAKNIKVEWLNETDDVIVYGDFSEIGNLTPQNNRTFSLSLSTGAPEVMVLRYTWEDDYSTTNTIEEQVQL